jgi:DNA invertase Pin-like site-specific DNA recombinase
VIYYKNNVEINLFLENMLKMPKTIAYVRVSTDDQDYRNQKYEILNYCDGLGITVDRWLEVKMSSYRSAKDNGKEDIIKGFLEKGVTRANIARILNVSWGTMDNFIKTRDLL